MRYCGSVDTISSYQKIRKQDGSPDQRTGKLNKVSSSYKTRTIKTSVESIAKHVSESSEAPKLMGISSKISSTKVSSKTHGKISIVDILVRYQELTESSETAISR